MICTNIKTLNFRNSLEADVNFTDGVNVLVGNNAQGKTNLLEAVYMFSLGKSFRAAKESDLVNFDCNEAKVSLSYRENSRSDLQNITMKIGKNRRRVIEINGLKIGKLSEMIGAFRAVLFCPEHLSLVKEGPSMRRSYLDVAISQFRPVYLRSLQRYYAILEQRNKLIKGAEDDRRLFDSTVDIWSAQLAHEAAIIASYREKYVKLVHAAVSEIIKNMSGEKELIEISYSGSGKLEDYSDLHANEERFLKLLTENHDREIGAGVTLWGVHKDDIDIRINSREARKFASQGQQRSIALALKLAEGEICRQETGDFPVLLLDDVLSELDSKRRNFLLSSVSGRQVIMTTCEDADFGDVNKITVENGKYIQNL